MPKFDVMSQPAPVTLNARIRYQKITLIPPDTPLTGQGPDADCIMAVKTNPLAHYKQLLTETLSQLQSYSNLRVTVRKYLPQ